MNPRKTKKPRFTPGFILPSIPEEEEVVEIKELTRQYLKDPSWFYDYVLSPLAWFTIPFVATLTIPVTFAKGIFELLTLQPIKALKTFILGPIAAVGLTLSSIIFNIFPSVASAIMRYKFLQSKYNSLKDQTILSKELHPTWGTKVRQKTVFPNHTVINQAVKTQKGFVDTVHFIPKKKGDTKYVIAFANNNSSFQETVKDYLPHIEEEMTAIDSFMRSHFKIDPRKQFMKNTRAVKVQSPDTLTHHFIGVNHPGFKSGEHYYKAESTLDLVNAGIAQAYQTISLLHRSMHPSSSLQRHILLSGEGLGGAIALEVAAHFKTQHDIDIPVFVNRTASSYSNVGASLLNRWAFMPTWCGKILASLLLFATGGWELNSVKAASKLNPKMLHYLNIGHERPQSKSAFQRFRERNFGPEVSKSADPTLADEDTLTRGIEKARAKDSIRAMTQSSTKVMFDGLDTRPQSHFIYKTFAWHEKSCHSQISSLRQLIAPSQNQPLLGQGIYAQVLRKQSTLTTASPHPQPAPVR